MPRKTRTPTGRRGAALVFTLIISIAVTAMALGAIMISSGATLATKFTAREAAMQAAANGGLEIIRDSLNHGIFDSLLPMDDYTTLVENEAVVDAYGVAMPRTTRSLYLGRTGGRTGGAATAGQYGSNFASALSVIRDQRGAVAVRRMLMNQESWSKFAVAINDWPGSAVYGCNESIAGPFHSNDVLRLQSGCNPKILFNGPASVVSSVSNQGSGNFAKGLRTGAAPIEWPTPARISLMQSFAAEGDAAGGDYDFTSLTVGSHTPGLRIEFLTIDVNANGTIEWDEGFMRVWRAKNTSDSALAYTTGRRWPTVPAGTTYNDDPNTISRNCGGRIRIGGTYAWYTARAVFDSVYNTVAGTASQKRDAARETVRWVLSRGNEGTRNNPVQNNGVTEVQCYLGGDPTLFHATYGTGGLTPDSVRTDTTQQPLGWWIKRRSGPHASVNGIRSDAAYLIPLGKNPNYKGVIFVTGDVAISGRLRGRTSIFATGNIVLADDLLYTVPPGTQCDAEGDIFGAIATINVPIADNNVQTPFRVDARMYGGYDDTPRDEQYHMFFLAAGDGTSGKGNFVTTGLISGVGPTRPYNISGTMNASATAESCSNAPAGCIRITGGMAMGKVEYATYSSNTYGYAEAHTYDKCGASNPPPYFPTTGRFIENRYYEVDPVWLSNKGIGNYFAEIRAQ